MAALVTDEGGSDARPAVAAVAVGLPTPALLPDFGAVDGLAADADLDDALGLVQRHLDAADSVLVVHPTWIPEPVRRRVATIRGLLGTTHLVTYATSLPPTAAGALACIAGRIGAGTPSAGHLLGILPDVEARIHVVTVLRSVAGLERPAPTLWQHARSHLPRSQFVVLRSGGTEEVRTRRSPDDLDLAVPDGQVAVHVADADGDPVWIGELLDAWVPDARVRLHAEDALEDRFWGHRGWTEAVVHPCDAEALVADALRGTPVFRCRWCAEPVPRAEQRCPHCRVELMSTHDRGAAA